MNNENLQDERRFNHALYHLVYHWAAYIATFVLLMTLGMLTVITPNLPTKAICYIVFANILGLVGSAFSLLRINDFAKIVVKGIGQSSVADTAWKIWKLRMEYPGNLWIAFAVAFLVFIVNLIVLFV